MVGLSLHDLVAESVARYPDHECAVFDDGHGEADTQPRMTYLELWQQVTQIKFALENLSVKERIIGVCLQDDLSIPAVLVGILASSCAFFPCSLESMGYTITALSVTGVSWLLVHSSLVQKISLLLERLKGSRIKSETLANHNIELYFLELVPALCIPASLHLAYSITTSGTTGTPKVVHVPHSCIVPNILDLRQIFHLDPKDRVLLTSPLTFDPSVIDIFCTLASGACLVIVPSELKRRPEQLLNVVCKRQAVTVLQATPALLRSLPINQLKDKLLGLNTVLRVLALGGEPFPTPELINKWVHPQNEKIQLYNLYGVTEVSCWASCQLVNWRNYVYNKQRVPIGQALSGTFLKLEPLQDEEPPHDKQPLQNEQPLQDDEGNVMGNIWIGGARRRCYIDDEITGNVSERESCLSSELEAPLVWRNTGDIGTRLPDGTIICLGRKDNQRKRHGKRLNLQALELVCKAVTGVQDCCAILDESTLMVFVLLEEVISTESGVSHLNNSGLIPLIYSDGARSSSCDGWDSSVIWDQLQMQLQKNVEETLPSHYRPCVFIKISTGRFPLTPNGKLDRKLLVQMGREHLKLGTVMDNLRAWSLELWQNNLPDSLVVIRGSDNFISLGGDSLAAVKLMTITEQICGHLMPILLDTLLNKDFDHFVHQLSMSLDQHRHILKTVGSELESSVCEMSDSVDATKDDVVVDPEVVLNTVPHKHKLLMTKADEIKAPKLSNTFLQEVSTYISLDHSLSVPGLNGDTFIPADNTSLQLHFQNESCISKLNNYIPSDLKKVISRGITWKTFPRDLSLSENDTELTFKEETKTETRALGDSSSPRAVPRMNVRHSPLTRCSVPGTLPGTVTSLKLRWKVDTGKCVDASPLLLELKQQTLAFIGSHSGQFLAVNVTTGDVLWRKVLPDRIESSACCSLCGSFVIVGCYNGVIYVFETWSGIIVWTFSTKDVVKCSPVVDQSNGSVLCGSHDGFLYSLDVIKKRSLWQCHLGGGSIFASPAIDSSMSLVYAATLAGVVVAINCDQGSVQWKVDLKKPVFASLCQLNQSVLIGCVGGQLYCLDSVGQIVWTFQTGAPIFSSPSIFKSSVLIGCHDHHVYCLTSNGKLVWAYKTSSPVYATCFPADMVTPTASLEDINQTSQQDTKHSLVVSLCPVVITASTDGNLYVLNLDTGSVLATLKLSGQIFSSPVVNDSLITVGCRDNFLYCFEIESLIT